MYVCPQVVSYLDIVPREQKNQRIVEGQFKNRPDDLKTKRVGHNSRIEWTFQSEGTNKGAHSDQNKCHKDSYPKKVGGGR